MCQTGGQVAWAIESLIQLVLSMEIEQGKK